MNAALRSLFAPTALACHFCRLILSSSSSQTFLDRKEVSERVLSVLRVFEKVDGAKLSATAHFANDLGLDSLDAVEVRASGRL